MKTKFFVTIIFACSVLNAGVNLNINVDFGPVFETPPQVVEVSPGIAIIPDYPEEVFFISGVYWVNRNNYWCRSYDHKKWCRVSERKVPYKLVKIQRGKYKNWHPKHENEQGNHGHGHGKKH